MLLQRASHANGIVTYFSPLLAGAGVTHAFSTRLGGRSVGPFHSLNLAQSSGGPSTETRDEDPAVESNYRLLQDALGLPNHRLVWCRQVHGCAAVTPTRETAAKPPEADALITDRPDVLLSIRVADCVPILLASRDGRRVVAVHAGWRGVVLGVLPRAIEAMRDRYGVCSDQLLAAVGPCISAAHFEVGPEVADEFRRCDLGHAVIERPARKPHIDLAGAVVAQLERAGVSRDRVDTTDRCTFRDADEFFSHRRDQGRTGRMAAVIAVRP